MNIFVTSPYPIACAERLYAYPKRAIKMITETQQILACCQHFYGFGELINKKDGLPYKLPKSIYNHPVVINFARSDIRHSKWLLEHLEALMCLYKGSGFTNVWDNIELLDRQLDMVVIEDYKRLNFYNFAKSDEKELDFRHLPVYTAYDQYLKAQKV